MARRTLTRRDAVGAALAAGSMLLAGCAGKGSLPAVKQVQPEEVEPAEPAEPIEQTAEPDPADWTQVELDPAPTLSWTVGTSDNSVTPNDWHWEDGVLATSVAAVTHTDADKAGQVSFAVWNPISGRRFEFMGSVAQPDEEFINDPFVTSTYGADRVAWLVYGVRQAADGLDPESNHVYAQQLDFDSGELGDRVEFPRRGLYKVGGHQVRIPSSETKIAVALHLDVTYTDNTLTVYSLAPDGSLDELQSERNFTVNSTNAAGVYESFTDEHAFATNHLYNVEDGTQIVESSEVRLDDAYRLSDDLWLVNPGSTEMALLSVSSGSLTSLEETIASLTAEYLSSSLSRVEVGYQLLDRSVILVAVDQIIRVKPDGSVEVLLEQERFRGLEAQVRGVDQVTGDVYLTTTDEQVIMNLAGEDAGNWTVAPSGGSYEQGTNTDPTQTKAVLWLERNDDDEVTRAVVTRGGQPT